MERSQEPAKLWHDSGIHAHVGRTVWLYTRHIEFDGDEYDVISYRKVAKEIEPSEFKRLEDRFKDSRIQYIRAMNSVVNCGFFSDVFRQIVKN